IYGVCRCDLNILKLEKLVDWKADQIEPPFYARKRDCSGVCEPDACVRANQNAVGSQLDQLAISLLVRLLLVECLADMARDTVRQILELVAVDSQRRCGVVRDAQL